MVGITLRRKNYQNFFLQAQIFLFKKSLPVSPHHKEGSSVFSAQDYVCEQILHILLAAPPYSQFL